MGVRRRYHFTTGPATRAGRGIRTRRALVRLARSRFAQPTVGRVWPVAGEESDAPVWEKIASPSEGGYQGSMDVPANAADQALLARVSGGDAVALRALYDGCATRAMSIALRVLGSRSEAEEVVQETFVQVWRRAASYDASRGGAMAWIATIARSRALDRLRARAATDRAVTRSEDPEPASAPAPSELAAQRELRTQVLAALAGLPQEQRSAIELAYYEGLSHSEIAERLGDPLGTVKTRVRLGLAKLAAVLGPHRPGGGS
jgi:RNA polymerase sigma-70 factor, ECF subfamily